MKPLATTAGARAEAGEGPLARRITVAPKLSAAEAAHARVEDWLAEIARAPAGKTLGRLFADHPTVKTLMAALAEGSPYLWELACADRERLVAILESEPERRFGDLLADARRMIPTIGDEAEVTRRQTAFADAALGAAVDHLLADAHRRGRLALADPARPSQGSGYIVLAVGKMGSNELNYSSDIDLIVFYDADAPALVPGTEPGAFFVRLTRALVKLLQERTADGYVFRTDLRLRPDPASTQIAISTAAALDYYESRGQNWERAAMIKARPC